MWRTADSSQSPVPSNVRGSVGQFESVGSSVGIEVSVYGCDIDGVGFGTLAHFCFLREDSRCIIVYVQQVDLQSTCPTCRGDTCRQTEGKREVNTNISCVPIQRLHPLKAAFEDQMHQ